MKSFLKFVFKLLLRPVYNQMKHLSSRITQLEFAPDSSSSSTLFRVGQLQHPGLTPGSASSSELFASSLCRIEDLIHPDYHAICINELKEAPRLHRKQWEWALILHVLADRGKLTHGSRGLGFGVGTEPLSSVFAHHGCTILGTDAPAKVIDAQWISTGQHSHSLDGMHHSNIISYSLFTDQCMFKELDMNSYDQIPDGYDFHWSSCVIEHLGSIAKAHEFILQSARRLAPGGIGVHTTEFNLSSAIETYDGADTCIFRSTDLIALREALISEGLQVDPLVFDPGTHPYNYHVDIPPYKSVVHTRLMLAGYASTSVSLIFTKPT